MDVKPPADVQESLLRSDGNEEEKIPLKSAKPVRSKGASFSLWLGPFFVRSLSRSETCFLPAFVLVHRVHVLLCAISAVS